MAGKKPKQTIRPMGRNKKVPAGHPGRGKPKVRASARKNAFGLVAGTNSPSEGLAADPRGIRLNKWLADQGVGSRRKCDALVQEGMVDVNGKVVVAPGYRVQGEDRIKVEGRLIQMVRRLYYIFYKPKGVLCTNDPRESRPRVADMVDHLVPSRVFPVGRLDEDSEGLLLLTNDGEFSNLVCHPRYGVPKTYTVLVMKSVSGSQLSELRKGAWIDGQKVVPEQVRISRKTRSSTLFEIVLREGRNREIRRLFARNEMPLKTLKRVRIGSLGVKGISRGGLRPLTKQERDELVEIALQDSSEKEAEGKRPPKRKR